MQYLFLKKDRKKLSNNSIKQTDNQEKFLTHIWFMIWGYFR